MQKLILLACLVNYGVSGSELDKLCSEMLGEVPDNETTTTPMPGSKAERSLILYEEFLRRITQEGISMGKQFADWIVWRVGAMIASLAVLSPLLAVIALRYSRRLRSALSRLDRFWNYTCLIRVSMCFVAMLACASAAFALHVANNVQASIYDLRGFYLTSFLSRLGSDFIDHFEHGPTIARHQEVSARLCNPTDELFKVNRLSADGYISSVLSATFEMKHVITLPPKSLGWLAVDYLILQDVGNVAALAVSAVGASAKSVYAHVLNKKVILHSHFRLVTEGVFRGTGFFLGIRINVPMDLGKLPPIWQWSVEMFSNMSEDDGLIMLFETLLSGAESNNLLEWESLDVGGGIMAYVYGTVCMCTICFVLCTFAITLSLLKCFGWFSDSEADDFRTANQTQMPPRQRLPDIAPDSYGNKGSDPPMPQPFGMEVHRRPSNKTWQPKSFHDITPPPLAKRDSDQRKLISS